MNLLHPWALGIGAAAIALPILVHWLTRPRPVTLPLSTIRFVRQAVQQRRARYRLRDLIILALRMIAIALIAWAFSRPLAGQKAVVADAPGDAMRVVILDHSQSMAAVSGGVQAFERARAAAAKHLAYSPGLRGNLILAGAKPTAVFPALSANFAAIGEALAASAPRGEELNVQPALERAAAMFAAAPPGVRKELVIISDFQRNNWAVADFSPLPKETVIHLESAAPAQPPANLAVLRVGVQGRAEQNRETRVEVEVGNYSPTPRDVKVDVSIGGVALRLGGVCPPSGKTTLSGDCVLPKSGWLIGEAKLAGASDALAADDVRAFVLEVRPTPTYALVTREASTPKPTSSHYLERALAPVIPREKRPAERVVRVDPATLDREGIASADLVVFDHPGRLKPESLKLVASLLRRGRSVLYVAAEPADAANLATLAEAAGSDLKLPVQYAAPAAGQGRTGLFITSFRKEDPLFSVFGDDAAASISPLRFAGGLATRRLESGVADDVLATYSDQTAALVVTSCGAGTLAIFNVSLADSTLPGSGAFVPLIGELTDRLMSRRKTGDTAHPGEQVLSFLPPEAGSSNDLKPVAINPTGKAGDTGALTEEGGSVLWKWDAAGPPGVYAVRRGATDVFALATTIAPGESDLSSMDPAVLKDRLAGGRTISFQAAGASEESGERDTRWAWITAACAMCMVLEIGVLKLFRT
jgi:hypothetical protein